MFYDLKESKAWIVVVVVGGGGGVGGVCKRVVNPETEAINNETIGLGGPLKYGDDCII